MADLLVPMPLNRGHDASWVVMPQFLQRVRAFSERRDPNAESGAVCSRFAAAFGAGDSSWWGLVLIDGEGVVKGHVLACIEERRLSGVRYAMVWQWEKDAAVDPMTDEISRQHLETWAKTQGVTRISALALATKKDRPCARARLFQRFGFEVGPQLVTRRLGDD